MTTGNEINTTDCMEERGTNIQTEWTNEMGKATVSISLSHSPSLFLFNMWWTVNVFLDFPVAIYTEKSLISQ